MQPREAFRRRVVVAVAVTAVLAMIIIITILLKYNHCLIHVCFYVDEACALDEVVDAKSSLARSLAGWQAQRRPHGRQESKL